MRDDQRRRVGDHLGPVEQKIDIDLARRQRAAGGAATAERPLDLQAERQQGGRRQRRLRAQHGVQIVGLRIGCHRIGLVERRARQRGDAPGGEQINCPGDRQRPITEVRAEGQVDRLCI